MDLIATNPFVRSIAYSSGVQAVNEEDEPLGLVSALFVQEDLLSWAPCG
jgi:hypothetical protein